ncbi:MAG TPA: type II secretion system minor pseudopilin GspK [Ramlibacter sp.]|nr:type II secretion system minor pseudopilin GspK [Ramlibacter sp.]
MRAAPAGRQPPRRIPTQRTAQAGAALLAAMLTVTLVATFAAAALWQQWRTVEVEAADRSRVQSSWILTGAQDWARLILREDFRAGQQDHLAEPWAVPLQEARLSTFLAADQNNNADTGDADNVFLSGEIQDLQAKLNLTTMVNAGVLHPEWAETFRRLFEVLGLPSQEYSRLAENMRFAADISIDNRNAARAPLMPQRLEQVVWLGVSPATAAALEPYVTVLPTTSTMVNINTAPAEVIYAVGQALTLGDAKRIVAEREQRHFQQVDEAERLLPPFEGPVPGKHFHPGRVSVSSRFFEVRGRLRMDDVVIEERSIMHREGPRVRTVQRERGGFEPFTPQAPRR